MSVEEIKPLTRRQQFQGQQHYIPFLRGLPVAMVGLYPKCLPNHQMEVG